MDNTSSEHSKHNAINTGLMIYRYMVVGAAMLPIICITMVTLFAFTVILYILGSFIVVAIS